jgi:fimbrial chaperone protein
MDPDNKLKFGNMGFSLMILFFLFQPALSLAGSFKISPIYIHIDSKTKTTTIKITNQGDERVTVQLDVKEWRQNETGPDTYKQTRDIVFFPKIVTIEKEAERIIRIGYQREEVVAKEKTYQLYIKELPVTKPGEKALKFTFNILVPIYVDPIKEFKKFSIEKVEFSEGKLAVKVKNSGNTHFSKGKVTAIGLDSFDKEVFKTGLEGWYVLAGVVRTLDIYIPKEDCRRTSKIRVAVEVEHTTMVEDRILDKTQCVNIRDDHKILGAQLKN